jgi:hypothetical protein
MARRKGWRAVKSRYAYSVDEAARNQGVSKGTVLRWLKSGLPCTKDKRPYLILGGDFVDFLKGLIKPKCKMAADEFRCFRCKGPRKAALGEADYRPDRPLSGMLIALCCDCSTVMNKGISLANLEPLKRVLQISFPFGHETLGKAFKARSNDHFGRK